MAQEQTNRQKGTVSQSEVLDRLRWFRMRFIWNYHPPGRFFARYRNGITIRVWKFGFHAWVISVRERNVLKAT